MSIRQGILLALAIAAAAALGLGLFGVTVNQFRIGFGSSGVHAVQEQHYPFNSPLVIGIGLLLALIDVALLVRWRDK